MTRKEYDEMMEEYYSVVRPKIEQERLELLQEEDRELARLRSGESQIDVTDDDNGFPTSFPAEITE